MGCRHITRTFISSGFGFTFVFFFWRKVEGGACWVDWSVWQVKSFGNLRVSGPQLPISIPISKKRYKSFHKVFRLLLELAFLLGSESEVQTSKGISSIICYNFDINRQRVHYSFSFLIISTSWHIFFLIFSSFFLFFGEFLRARGIFGYSTEHARDLCCEEMPHYRYRYICRYRYM